MKSFSEFLKETTRASLQAKHLGLTNKSPDGKSHGDWYNKFGELVAKAKGNNLVFYNQGQRVGKDPKQVRTVANQSISSAQSSVKEDTITVAFGRFNPPTVGHKVLLDKAKEISENNNYKIYPSRTKDNKKNPLDPESKIYFMCQMFPEHSNNIIDDENVKNILDVLKEAYIDGYTKVNIVVGSDRQSEFEKLANQYNGELYEFADLTVVSAGERNSESTGIEGMSASKLRKAVAEGDFQTFKTGIVENMKYNVTVDFYNSLRKSMNLDEDYSLWEIAPKFDWQNLRENYIAKKIFQIGQFVENLNTGMIGKIIRRGTNYLICVTEENIMFKSWIKDVMEYTEVKVDSEMRDKDHPNTLVGTLGAFKNYANLTPGAVGTGKENLAQGQKAYGINFINKYKKK